MNPNNKPENHCVPSVIGLFMLCLMMIVSARADLLTQNAELTFRYSVRGYHGNAQFSEPAALGVDNRAGLVYLADVKAGTLSAFSLQGVGKFQYAATQELKAPVGVAIDRDSNVYVAEDEGGPLKIIDARGEVRTFALPATEGEDLPLPGRMTFDRDGNLYIVDRANCHILVFDKELKFKLSFGKIGEKPGTFKALQAVAVDREGRIYAVDAIGIPVQVFDRKGGLLFTFGRIGSEDDLVFPTGIAVDRHDQVWIVDQEQHCLRVFDRSGQLLRKFGVYGQGEGAFFHPNDVAVDDFGHVYVSETGTHRMQVFSLDRPFEAFR